MGGRGTAEDEKRLIWEGGRTDKCTHGGWFAAQEVQVSVFTKEIGLGLRCVETLASHDEVTAKVVSWGGRDRM